MVTQKFFQKNPHYANPYYARTCCIQLTNLDVIPGGKNTLQEELLEYTPDEPALDGADVDILFCFFSPKNLGIFFKHQTKSIQKKITLSLSVTRALFQLGLSIYVYLRLLVWWPSWPSLLRPCAPSDVSGMYPKIGFSGTRKHSEHKLGELFSSHFPKKLWNPNFGYTRPNTMSAEKAWHS